MSIKTIALPTAEKQDDILRMVKNYTGDKELTPVFKEQITYRKDPSYYSGGIGNLSMIAKDTNRGVYICVSSIRTSFVLVDINTLEIIKTINISSSNMFHDNGYNYAYDGDGTLFFTLQVNVYGNPYYCFTTLNIDTGVITDKGIWTTEANIDFMGNWCYDAETGYLYVLEVLNGTVYMFTDPKNTMDTTPTVGKKIKLSQAGSYGLTIIGNYLYAIGTKPNAYNMTIFKMDKNTLSVVASKNLLGATLDFATPMRLFVSDDSKYIYAHQRGGYLVKIDANTLEAQNLRDGGVLTNNLFIEYDGNHTFYFIEQAKLTSSSNSNTYSQAFSELDTNTGSVYKRTYFKDNFYIDSAISFIEYDILNDSLMIILKDEFNRWYKNYSYKIYIPDGYINGGDI